MKWSHALNLAALRRGGAMFVKMCQQPSFRQLLDQLNKKADEGILKGGVCKIAGHGESCIGWFGDFPIYMLPRLFCYLQSP